MAEWIAYRPQLAHHLTDLPRVLHREINIRMHRCMCSPSSRSRAASRGRRLAQVLVDGIAVDARTGRQMRSGREPRPWAWASVSRRGRLTPWRVPGCPGLSGWPDEPQLVRVGLGEPESVVPLDQGGGACDQVEGDVLGVG